MSHSHWGGYERHYAAPVSREGFYHSGDRFYVEIEHNRHERHDSRALYSLLAYTPAPPLLTKKGAVAKRQPAPHKDPAGHFYCAQLLHYGLRPLKTKGPAKEHLLAAFGRKRTLAVPDHILQLEKALKEEYRLANDAAQQKHTAAEEERTAEEERQRKKRKRDQDDLMQEFLDVGIAINTGTMNDNGPGKFGLEEDEDLADDMSRKELLAAVAALPENRLRKIVAQLVHELPEVEGTMRREVSKIAKQKKAGSSKAPVKAAKSSKGKKRGKKLEYGDHIGQFDAIVPYISEQWPELTEGGLTLRLALSSTSSHVWGSFNFGVISGIIRSSFSVPVHVGDTCTFIWRGREAGENVISIGGGNHMDITFLGGGKVKGQIKGSVVGKCEFVGKGKEARNVVWSKSVKGWKESWRALTERHYESENKGRWGGWSETPRAEGPADSDTSGGGGGGATSDGDDDEDEDEDVGY